MRVCANQFEAFISFITLLHIHPTTHTELCVRSKENNVTELALQLWCREEG